MKIRDVVTTLAFVTSVSSPVRADDIAPVGMSGVMVGSRVRLTAPTVLQGKLQGAITAMDEKAVVLAADSGVPVVVPREAITSLDVSAGRKKNALKGTVIGAAAGAVLMLVAAPVDPNNCGVDSPNVCSRGQGVGIGAVGGAVWGVLIGSFIKTDRWMHAPTGSWRVDVKPAPRGASVSMSLSF